MWYRLSFRDYLDPPLPLLDGDLGADGVGWVPNSATSSSMETPSLRCSIAMMTSPRLTQGSSGSLLGLGAFALAGFRWRFGFAVASGSFGHTPVRR